MKKLFLILALLVACAGYSQQYQSGKILSAVTFKPGIHPVEIPMGSNQPNGARPDWHWNVQMEYTSHSDTTKHSYVKVQQCGTDGTGPVSWINYAAPLVTDSLKFVTNGYAVFEDPLGYCGRKLRLYVYVGAADTLKGVSIWYTLISK